MEIMTRDEMQERFGKLMERIDALERKLTAVDKDEQANYRREEAAKYLGVCVRKLDELSAKGEIPKARIGHGQKAVVLFRKSDLDAYVAKRMEMDGNTARLKVIGG